MSAPYAVVPRIEEDTELTGGAKGYAMHLCRHLDAHGVAWPSRRYSAQVLGVSERTISRWRGQLESRGHVRRIAGGFRGMVTRFTVRDLEPRNAGRTLEKMQHRRAGRGWEAYLGKLRARENRLLAAQRSSHAERVTRPAPGTNTSSLKGPSDYTGQLSEGMQVRLLELITAAERQGKPMSGTEIARLRAEAVTREGSRRG